MLNTDSIFIRIYSLIIIVVACQSTACSKKADKEEPIVPPVTELVKRNIIIDKSTKYQTIDGFGFFGAFDV
jgi:hypothetical protein